VKKIIWANLLRIIELLPKKLSLSSQKYGFEIRDPRPGIRKKPIPDPGVKKAPAHGSRIRIRNTEVNCLISFPAGPSSRAIQVIEASEEQHLSMYTTLIQHLCLLVEGQCIIVPCLQNIRMLSLDFFLIKPCDLS
jgi:hypothetical protein